MVPLKCLVECELMRKIRKVLGKIWLGIKFVFVTLGMFFMVVLFGDPQDKAKEENGHPCELEDN